MTRVADMFLGRWKSGRTWKSTDSSVKSSSRIVSNGADKKSWDEKMAIRTEREHEKRLLKEIAEKKTLAKETVKAEREAGRLRREQNARISELKQTVTNMHKLKRMTKKQRANLRVKA